MSVTGSTKTADDVQNELNEITSKLWVYSVMTTLSNTDKGISRAIEKERQSLSSEKERQQNALRTFESKAHQLELEEQKSLSKLNEIRAVSERLEELKKDVASFTAQIKVSIFKASSLPTVKLGSTMSSSGTGRENRRGSGSDSELGR